jgi:hypothetical protein
MLLFLITLSVFVLVILMMAIGVLMGRQHLKGSCGGPDGCDLCLFKNSSKCHRNHRTK